MAFVSDWHYCFYMDGNFLIFVFFSFFPCTDGILLFLNLKKKKKKKTTTTTTATTKCTYSPHLMSHINLQFY